MPREELFGKREEDAASSDKEGMRLATEIARSGVLFGQHEKEGTGPEGRGMRRGELFGRSEELFG
jgi:hypothetical protein